MKTTKEMKRKLGQMFVLLLAGGLMTSAGFGQDAAEADAMVTSSSLGQQGGELVIKASGLRLPELAALTSVKVDSTATVDRKSVQVVMQVEWTLIQGKPEALSLGVDGDCVVEGVAGVNVGSWVVRRDANARHVVEVTPLAEMNAGEKLSASITLKHELRNNEKLNTVRIPTASAAGNVGFYHQVILGGGAGVFPKLSSVEGVVPLVSDGATHAFAGSQAASIWVVPVVGGRGMNDIGAWSDTKLEGVLSENGKSIEWTFTGSYLSKKEMDTKEEVFLLNGAAAPTEVTVNGLPGTVVVGEGKYSLKLASPSEPMPDPFAEAIETTPSHQVEMKFVSKVNQSGGIETVNFTVPTSGVTPMRLTGLDENVVFRNTSVVSPQWVAAENQWSAFLPISGQVGMGWTRPVMGSEEGRLFFTVLGNLRFRVDAGLVEQQTVLRYNLLQGEISELRADVTGPGEIVDVTGSGISGWELLQENGKRVVVATLSQSRSKTDETYLVIRSRTPVGAFPADVASTIIRPEGAVRYSGNLSVTSVGAVRAEVTEPVGLVQVAAGDPRPGERQGFAFQFPSGEFGFALRATRVVPEVGVNALAIYRMGESDLAIELDLEIDVREAPLQELPLEIPDGYAVAKVAGSEVADYVLSSRVVDGRRELKVLFRQAVSGRHFVTVGLEKSQPAAEGAWVLDRVTVPDARSVRGFVGVVPANGYRLSEVVAVEGAVESPLTFFPKRDQGVQQAFRMREADWEITMNVQALGQSVEADVFHLYSLREGMAYGSVLMNFFVVGAPVSEWRVEIPEELGNLLVDGEGVRGWRRDGDVVVVELNKSTSGASTILFTFEYPMPSSDMTLKPGIVKPLGVQNESGYVQLVSPYQVLPKMVEVSDDLLRLETSELPAEYRLLTQTPTLAAFQYSTRPFAIEVKFDWFAPGETAEQVVDFAKIRSTVARDGQVMTEATFFVKTRGRKPLELMIPEGVKLWGVEVNDRSIAAQTDGNATMIPLPPNADPNTPVRVKVRVGQSAVDDSSAVLKLPAVGVPLMMADWKVEADSGRMLLPSGGDVSPPEDPRRAVGSEVIALGRGILPALMLCGAGLVALVLVVSRRWLPFAVLIGIGSVFVALGAAALVVDMGGVNKGSLEYSVPAMEVGKAIEIEVKSVPMWRAMLSFRTILFGLIGGGLVLLGLVASRVLIRFSGWILLALACLLQFGGAPLFFLLIAGVCFFEFILAPSRVMIRRAKDRKVIPPKPPVASTALVLLAGMLALGSVDFARADKVAAPQEVLPQGLSAISEIDQSWVVEEERISASGTIVVSGEVGDAWLLLDRTARLKELQMDGFVVRPTEVAGQTFLLLVRSAGSGVAKGEFRYELPVVAMTGPHEIPTGQAAIERLTVDVMADGWVVNSPRAISRVTGEGRAPEATLVLGIQGADVVTISPRGRDVESEEARYFVDGQHLYMPGPGVVNGVHLLSVRPSRGQLRQLTLDVPDEFTVSELMGDRVATWRFDPESRQLVVDLVEAVSEPFSVVVKTQRALAALPVDVTCGVLGVRGAEGEVNLIGLAFGEGAQLDSVLNAEGVAPVSLEDFNQQMLDGAEVTLRRVYRDNPENDTPLVVRVAAVDPEIRVTSEQVVSLGDQRVVLGATLNVNVARAGVFTLAVPIPDGFEVDSLTGEGVAHWAEGVSDALGRHAVLHLATKMKGMIRVDASFSGAGIKPMERWDVPQIAVAESVRSSGTLMVVPGQGLQIRAVDRERISQGDAREFGETSKGALAFRLLEKDWKLSLKIEALEPWITARTLQEVTLREGQSRTRMAIGLRVENAGINTLQVQLPPMSESAERTLRASAGPVSDLVKIDDSGLWEIRFQRRVIGDVEMVLDFQEISGSDPADGAASEIKIVPASVVGSRQQNRYVALRAGGRLALEVAGLGEGWQNAPWSAVPDTLKDRGDMSAPGNVMRVVRSDENPALGVKIERRNIADSLKLQVVSAELTTLVSIDGSTVTVADMRIKVVEKNTLRVTLPDGYQLMNAFVNEESVLVAEVPGASGATSYLIPVAADVEGEGMAVVRFAYRGGGAANGDEFALVGPAMNVPMKSIEWQVSLPEGVELSDFDEGYSLVGQRILSRYGVDQYLSLVETKKLEGKQKATDMLDQANVYLQQGEQEKARRTLSKVAKGNKLDAASNEDARVQWKSLQTQQALVSLNTRRQKMELYNGSDLPNQAGDANTNPLLNDDINYNQAQAEAMFAGNTIEENTVLRRLAERIIDQQQAADPAPEGIELTIPSDGNVVTFRRALQVAGDAPLVLELEVDETSVTPASVIWGSLIAAGLALFVGMLRRERK